MTITLRELMDIYSAKIVAVAAAAEALVDGPEWWYCEDRGCIGCVAGMGKKYEVIHAADCRAMALDRAVTELREAASAYGS